MRNCKSPRAFGTLPLMVSIDCTSSSALPIGLARFVGQLGGHQRMGDGFEGGAGGKRQLVVVRGRQVLVHHLVVVGVPVVDQLLLLWFQLFVGSLKGLRWIAAGCVWANAADASAKRRKLLESRMLSLLIVPRASGQAHVPQSGADLRC